MCSRLLDSSMSNRAAVRPLAPGLRTEVSGTAAAAAEFDVVVAHDRQGSRHGGDPQFDATLQQPQRDQVVTEGAVEVVMRRAFPRSGPRPHGLR